MMQKIIGLVASDLHRRNHISSLCIGSASFIWESGWLRHLPVSGGDTELAKTGTLIGEGDSRLGSVVPVSRKNGFTALEREVSNNEEQRCRRGR